MSEPDIEKGKKRRRRSARVYVNANKPLAVNIPEIAALFPADDDDDGQAAEVGKRNISQSERKRLAREGKAVVNPDGHVSYPIANAEDLENAATLARTGHGDVEAARKLIRRRAKELGVPVPDLGDSAAKAAGNPHNPGGRSVTDRISPPLTAGHQAPSTGDHGADPMNVPGPRSIAFGHQDMRQSSTSFNDVIARLRTVNGAGNGDRDITYTAGEVGLNLFNARGQAGAYPGMQPVGHSPERPDWHQSRGSATPPSGSHGLADVRSHAAPMAAKSNSELRADFKRMLFPGSGGGR